MIDSSQPRAIPAALTILSRSTGDCVRAAPLDVRDERAAYGDVQLAVDTFGRLDVLVNNAGYGQPFEQMSAADFKAVVDTCFCGVVYTTGAAVPLMRKQKSSHILQVSSVGGRMAIAGNTPYHAAKWAGGGFIDALAMEFAPVRGQGLHAGAGRHSDQLGAAGRAECAGSAARL